MRTNFFELIFYSLLKNIFFEFYKVTDYNFILQIKKKSNKLIHKQHIKNINFLVVAIKISLKMNFHYERRPH